MTEVLTGLGRAKAGPDDFLIRKQSGPDHQSYKDSGRIQLKDQLKKLKIFSLFKIPYLIINKSYIVKIVHNLSLIFKKFFKIQKLFKNFVLF